MTNSSEDNQSIKFIDGKFNPEEAKEILVDLLNNKINFHSLKNFSAEERFGKPIEGSKKRIEELRSAKEKIEVIIKKALVDNTNLRIESSINIGFER
jgi:polyhydroxyalkanoate synthesis regulator phasin